MLECDDGEYVTFEDHKRLMRIAREALKEIRSGYQDNPGYWSERCAEAALAALGEDAT